MRGGDPELLSEYILRVFIPMFGHTFAGKLGAVRPNAIQRRPEQLSAVYTAASESIRHANLPLHHGRRIASFPRSVVPPPSGTLASRRATGNVFLSGTERVLL